MRVYIHTSTSTYLKPSLLVVDLLTMMSAWTCWKGRVGLSEPLRDCLNTFGFVMRPLRHPSHGITRAALNSASVNFTWLDRSALRKRRNNCHDMHPKARCQNIALLDVVADSARAERRAVESNLLTSWVEMRKVLPWRSARAIGESFPGT